jgi:hypothetical protein
MKLDLLTNATVVSDAIKFINEKSVSNSKAISQSKDKEENE